MTETEGLLAQIAGLQQQVVDLQQQVVQLTTVEPNNAEPRFGVALNTTYDAPVTGYLSVASTDGRTGRVKLLVGYEVPAGGVRRHRQHYRRLQRLSRRGHS